MKVCRVNELIQGFYYPTFENYSQVKITELVPIRDLLL